MNFFCSSLLAFSRSLSLSLSPSLSRSRALSVSRSLSTSLSRSLALSLSLTRSQMQMLTEIRRCSAYWRHCPRSSSLHSATQSVHTQRACCSSSNDTISSPTQTPSCASSQPSLSRYRARMVCVVCVVCVVCMCVVRVCRVYVSVCVCVALLLLPYKRIRAPNTCTQRDLPSSPPNCCSVQVWCTSPRVSPPGVTTAACAR